MKTVRINAGGGYDVHAGSGLLKKCGELAAIAVRPCRAAVVTDSNVAPLYLKNVMESLSGVGFEPVSLTVPAGEGSKSMDMLGRVLNFLAASGLSRTDCVAALGGGVTGDLAGFAAACYMRGVSFLQLPTTLLAAVDSSVGGKTAVDLPSGKNLAGAFHQPKLVVFDSDCLSTLPESELKNGLAEAAKTAVLAGGELFSRMSRGDMDMEYIVSTCVGFKGGVVERDEFEAGERKLLNLGHTAAHAIERLGGYAVPHGAAVAAGTAIIARASARLGWSDEKTARDIVSLLQTCGLAVGTGYGAKELAAAALADKKRSGGSITLAVPERVGGCVLKRVPVCELEAVFAAGLEAL